MKWLAKVQVSHNPSNVTSFNKLKALAKAKLSLMPEILFQNISDNYRKWLFLFGQMCFFIPTESYETQK
jgi:hypothetical protein